MWYLRITHRKEYTEDGYGESMTVKNENRDALTELVDKLEEVADGEFVYCIARGKSKEGEVIVL